MGKGDPVGPPFKVVGKNACWDFDCGLYTQKCFDEPTLLFVRLQSCSLEGTEIKGGRLVLYMLFFLLESNLCSLCGLSNFYWILLVFVYFCCF